jgi:hypothetical protein
LDERVVNKKLEAEDALDLIIFPQLSRELDQIDLKKHQILEFCTQKINEIKDIDALDLVHL